MLLRRSAYVACIHTTSSECGFVVTVRRCLLRIMLRLPSDDVVVPPHVYIFGRRGILHRSAYLARSRVRRLGRR